MTRIDVIINSYGDMEGVQIDRKKTAIVISAQSSNIATRLEKPGIISLPATRCNEITRGNCGGGRMERKTGIKEEIDRRIDDDDGVCLKASSRIITSDDVVVGFANAKIIAR